MTKEQIIVIYVYEKIPAKVIVKHLEKVIIEVEGEEEAKVEEKEILEIELSEIKNNLEENVSHSFIQTKGESKLLTLRKFAK